MSRHIYRYLTAIIVLLVIVAWIDWPNNPGYILGQHINTDTKTGLDLSGGLRVLLEANPVSGSAVTPQQMQDTLNILQNRVNGLGLSDVTFQMVGTNRILAEFPGLTNTDQVISLLKQTGQMAFVPMGTNRLAEGTVIQVDYSKVASSSVTTTPGTPSSSTTVSALTGTPPTATGTSTQTQVSSTATSSATTGAATTTTPIATGSTVATSTIGPSLTPGPTGTPAPVIYQALMTGNDLIGSSIAVSKDTLGQYQISFSFSASQNTFLFSR